MLLTKVHRKSHSFRKYPFVFCLARSVFEFRRYSTKWCKQVGKDKVEQDRYRAVRAIHIHENGLCTSPVLYVFLTSRTIKRRWVFPTCSVTCYEWYQNSTRRTLAQSCLARGRGTGSRGCQMPPVRGSSGQAGALHSSRQGCRSAASACLARVLLFLLKNGGAETALPSPY